MKRLTNEQKKMIADLKDSKTPSQIAEHFGVSQQRINYYFRKNNWGRQRLKYYMNDTEKQFIKDNAGILNPAEMSIKLWGLSTDTTRSRIYTYAERERINLTTKAQEKFRLKQDPKLVEMVRQAAQKFMKTA
jgi:hypothetical protein